MSARCGLPGYTHANSRSRKFVNGRRMPGFDPSIKGLPIRSGSCFGMLRVQDVPCRLSSRHRRCDSAHSAPFPYWQVNSSPYQMSVRPVRVYGIYLWLTSRWVISVRYGPQARTCDDFGDEISFGGGGGGGGQGFRSQTPSDL